MIIETDVVNYNRTPEQLEEFLLFCIFVANKPANITAKKLDEFLRFGTISESSFEVIKRFLKGGYLDSELKRIKVGQYKRIGVCLRELVTKISSGEQLKNILFEELISIHGIGYKTASYFISCTQKNCRRMALDTHALRFLRDMKIQDVPKSTPGNLKQYQRLEKEYLNFADKYPELKPAEFDLYVWKFYSGRTTEWLPKELIQLYSVEFLPYKINPNQIRKVPHLEKKVKILMDPAEF